MEIFWFLLIGYFMLFLLLYFSVVKETGNLDKRKKAGKENLGGIIVLLVIALAVKVGFMYVSKGIFSDSYGGGVLQSNIASWLSIGKNTDGYYLISKIPNILADIAAAFLIYKLSVSGGWKNNQSSVMVAAFLFLPATMAATSMIGYWSGFFVLAVVWGIIAEYKGKTVPATLLLTAGAFFNPMGIVILIVYLIYIGLERDSRSLGISLATLLIAVFGLAFLFGAGNNFVSGLQGLVNIEPVLSKNAAGIWSAIGQNGAQANLFGSVVSVIVVLAVLAGGYLTLKKSQREDTLWFVATFAALSVSLICIGQNPCSMVIGCVLMLVLAAKSKDDRFFAVFAVLALVQSVVMGMTLQGANTGGAVQLISKTDGVFLALSWLSIITYGFFVYIGVDIYWLDGKISEDKKIKKKVASKSAKHTAEIQRTPGVFMFQRSDMAGRLVKTDIVLILILMLIYGCLGFTNLGSMNTPQTGFEPETENAAFVIELEQSSDIERVYMFTCWADRRADNDVKRAVTLSASYDGVNFEDVKEMEFKDVLRWRYEAVSLKGVSALKFTVHDEPRFVINEIALWGQDKETPVALKAVKDLGGCGPTLSNLIDEQDKAEYKLSYYNGSYFDEIYHPRTAYEHMHLLEMYENSHPPLGKLTIALGMAIFGVTPFGWRFFGVFFAMMMIPFLYAFAKKMFKSTKWAFIAAFLLVFDFMTTSQARLATIDTYITFYIILMYYFMYKYYSMSFYETKLSKTLVPLGLSGLMFGIGIATKWTGFYAGLGLAILFFISIIKRYREYNYAKSHSKEKENNGISLDYVKQTFVRNTVVTLVFCVVMFVIVPAACYIGAYTPYFMIPKDNHDWAAFSRLQKHMFNYHSGLTATHPYASPWYQWPLVIRPIMYAISSAEFMEPGMTYSIVGMGNPLIWWMTIPCMLGTVYMFLKRKGTKELLVITVAFSALYLPWSLISRNVFIYHFFTNTPLLMLWIVYFLKYLTEQKKMSMGVVYGYMAVVVICYAMFYPVLAGVAVPTDYINNVLEWLPSWNLA